MDGPSILPLHDKARRLLATWVKIIWPMLPKKGSNNVSLQNDGKRKTMEVNPTSGRETILVPNHERGVDGPSILPLHDKARRLLATWVKIIWPKLPKKGSNNVSLQNDGSSFHGWTIGRSLPEIWRKSVVCLDLRVTVIDIHWWIVNTTHEKKTQGASFDECNLR